MLLLSISIGAYSQTSITARLDSIKAINDRQITTSTPPNLVYPVQVGSKTDSLCDVIQSLRDSLLAIVGATQGLQQVTDNLDTTDNNIIVGDGFYRTIHNSQYISTSLKLGNVLQTALGEVGSLPSLYLKDNGSAYGAKLITGSLTANAFSYLPNEGVLAGGIKSTLVLHHTKDIITVDATGTGDSTHIAQGFVSVYAPPVTTYNLAGDFLPTGLFLGQRNAAHTHQDGVTIYYGANGTNYNDTIPNASGYVITTSSPYLASNQILTGNGVNAISSPDFTNDGSTLSWGAGGNSYMQIMAGRQEIGDITPVANGTTISLNDGTKSVSINGALAFTATQVYTAGANVTINDGIATLFYDPASLVTAATITLPAAPSDGQVLVIEFGGTITSGSVITTCNISANAGQTAIGLLSLAPAVVGKSLTARYRKDIMTWYVN